MSESGAAEDRAKKFMMDAARLAEELRAEQDNAVVIEKERREQEARAKDLQVQLDDAETNAIKWGRKMVAKLESRGRELEAELDSEQRRCGDAAKNFRKAERMIREYTFKADEDKKNSEKLQDLIEKLQQQIKTYKKQIEEAEEIASLNLAKFRKAQLDLADTSERADLTEQVGRIKYIFFSFAHLGDGENSWITDKCQGPLPLPPLDRTGVLDQPYITLALYYTGP